MKGLFIVFDGIDGCGKSTQLARAAGRLSEEGFSVVTTREPGGTEIAEKIRAVILSEESGIMVDECELLLYAAARAQHVRERIKPVLSEGAIVLCDRFDCATFAYQGFGRNLPFSIINTVNDIASGGIRPDLTFIFDIGVDAAFARLSTMGKSRDRLEASDREFFTRVAEGYRTLAIKNPENILLLNAELPVEELGERVFEKIKKTIGENPYTS